MRRSNSCSSPALKASKRTVKLTHTLALRFIELGLLVCGGRPGLHIGEIVTVGQYGSGVALSAVRDAIGPRVRQW
jgi:hypothetical protein